MNGPIGMAQAADHGDDENADDLADADGAGRYAPVEPDVEHARRAGDEAGEEIGGDPVMGDVVADRAHATLVVARRHQRAPESGARAIDDDAIGERGDAERQIVERDLLAPVDAEHRRRRDAAETGMAVEQRVVLLREIEEGGGDRQRDHDGVDAGRPDGDHADQRRDDAGDQDRNGHIEPPGPAEAEHARAVGAENCDAIAGHARDGELRERDHPAVAGEHHQRERDHAEDQRLRAELEDDERRNDEREEDQRDAEPRRSPA